MSLPRITALPPLPRPRSLGNDEARTLEIAKLGIASSFTEKSYNANCVRFSKGCLFFNLISPNIFKLTKAQSALEVKNDYKSTYWLGLWSTLSWCFEPAARVPAACVTVESVGQLYQIL